jgi:hypothetical protein
VEPWWERIPGRLSHELAALEQDGIRVERDDGAFARGTLQLLLTLPEGAWPPSRLRAVYPDTFPRTRPEVFAIDIILDRHQNPFGRNLCLLGRSTSNWRPSDTLAGLLRTQLPLLRQALESPDSTDFEELQGEPITAFYEYDPGAMLFVDSAWTLPADLQSGRLQIALLDSSAPLRGVIAAIGDHDGQVLAPGPFIPQNARTINASWFRVDQPIVENDVAKFLETLSLTHSDARKALRRDEVIGVVFPEETGHKVKSDGWLFVQRRTSQRKSIKSATVSFVRAGRIGLKDLSARYPFFATLQKRGAAVFGLGCLGAPSLLEFARCGFGRLRFLDTDIVEPGTIVRWPLGLSATGWPKAIALANFIAREYPWANLKGRSHRLGWVDQNPSDSVVLEEFLKDVDIVYDATAETGLQNVLSTVAAEKGLPYVCVSAIAGGVGGIAARLRPPTTGCWWCLQKSIDDGAIQIPSVPEDGMVQPEGCATLTYVGADYDLQEVALQGVRLTIAALVQDRADYAWDVGVLSLVGEKGERIAPQWSTYSLSRHPACTVCNRA